MRPRDDGGMNPTLIRRASPVDLPQLATLFDGYRQFYSQASDVPAAAAFLAERFEQSDSVILVAEGASGTLLGFTQLYPTFSSVRMRTSWILNDLFVDSSSRSLGLGEELLKAAEAFSLASGSRGLTLQTARTNLTAQRLYERLGWTQDEKFLTYQRFH